jgi:large subunit ribosomal protein L31e
MVRITSLLRHDPWRRSVGVNKLTNKILTVQGTKDVRLDPQLNKKVWEAGIKGVPFRLRVRISRKRNDEEGAKEKLYSYVQAVNVKNARGLQTTLVEDA